MSIPSIIALEVETGFSVDDGIWLAGTLEAPAGARGAVLILSGSGPLDRDSNMPGQEIDVSKAFAEAFSVRGIASLRFDKRGVGRSGGEYLTTSFDRETADAAGALEYLATRPEIDPARLVVLGHSAGGTIAIRLAAGPRPLAGVVLLSCAARNGEDVMADQTERIAATLRGLQRLGAGRLKRRQAEVRGELLSSTGDVITIEGEELPAGWFREFMAYDPAVDLPRIECPVLAITGGDDVQVDPADVERMRTLVAASFTGSAPEGLSHILRMTVDGPGLADYAKQLKEPVDAALLDQVADWVAERYDGR